MTTLALLGLSVGCGVALAYWQGRDDGRRAERRRLRDVYSKLEWTGDRCK